MFILLNYFPIFVYLYLFNTTKCDLLQCLDGYTCIISMKSGHIKKYWQGLCIPKALVHLYFASSLDLFNCIYVHYFSLDFFSIHFCSYTTIVIWLQRLFKLQQPFYKISLLVKKYLYKQVQRNVKIHFLLN
jgi:hypothetical protein